MTYVPLGSPRFKTVTADAGEMLVIPAQRNLFVTLFLMAWLGIWTTAGIAAIRWLWVEFRPFLAFWTVAWAIGWMAVVTTLAWMLTGRETLRMTGRDLEIGYAIAGIRRRKLYRGADVKGLNVVSDSAVWQARSLSVPMFGRSAGSVRFSYGARAQSFGLGLDETEATQIIAWLRKRLPDA